MITAWQYLNRVRDNLTRKQEMEDQLARLRSLAYPGAIVVKAALVQTSADDKMARIMAEAEAKLHQYQQELARIRRERVQAQYWIDQLPSPLLRQLLEQYYLTPVEVVEEIGANCTKKARLVPQELSMVAATLGKSFGYIRNVHREAVEAFSVVSGLPLDADED